MAHIDHNSPIAPGSPYHQLGDGDEESGLETVANILAPIEAPAPEEEDDEEKGGDDKKKSLSPSSSKGEGKGKKKEEIKGYYGGVLKKMDYFGKVTTTILNLTMSYLFLVHSGDVTKKVSDAQNLCFVPKSNQVFENLNVYRFNRCVEQFADANSSLSLKYGHHPEFNTDGVKFAYKVMVDSAGPGETHIMGRDFDSPPWAQWLLFATISELISSILGATLVVLEWLYSKGWFEAGEKGQTYSAFTIRVKHNLTFLSLAQAVATQALMLSIYGNSIYFSDPTYFFGMGGYGFFIMYWAVGIATFFLPVIVLWLNGICKYISYTNEQCGGFGTIVLLPFASFPPLVIAFASMHATPEENQTKANMIFTAQWAVVYVGSALATYVQKDLGKTLMAFQDDLGYRHASNGTANTSVEVYDSSVTYVPYMWIFIVSKVIFISLHLGKYYVKILYKRKVKEYNDLLTLMVLIVLFERMGGMDYVKKLGKEEEDKYLDLKQRVAAKYVELNELLF